MTRKTPASTRGSAHARGFTLVELLVVIGIIAVLISILLPTLGRARKQATAVQCASNMRQITMAILQYTNANKGKLMPCQVLKQGTRVAGAIWPDGFGWSNELVAQKYIAGPNNFENGKVTNDGKNPFRCPDGYDDEFGGGSTSINPTWPTNLPNNSWWMIRSNSTRTDGLPTYGTQTWYQLNARTQTSAQNDLSVANTPSNTRVSPFMGFTSAATDNDITRFGFQRNISMVKKSSQMIMLVEAADPNWVDQTSQAALPNDTKPMIIRRIGARHGKRSANGYNAYLNVGFFDGHVELKDSQRFAYEDPIKWTEANDMIIYLNKQRSF